MPNNYRNDNSDILNNMEPEDIEVHNSCGSPLLEERRWVNINTNEVFGNDGTDDVYCNLCKEIIHISDIISMKKYDEENTKKLAETPLDSTVLGAILNQKK